MVKRAISQVSLCFTTNCNMNFKNMDMKTKVKMISEVHQCGFKVGEKGYIDGYVQAADKRPYACVVIGVRIELVPMYALEVIE